MVTGSLARRYARALMGLGTDAGNHIALGQEVARLAAALNESAELMQALTSPVFGRADRKRLLEAILVRLAVSTHTKNFALLLLDRERIVSVPAISREFSAMVDEKEGRTSGELISATVLTPAQVSDLKSILENLSGKTVKLTQRQDPELLGGVVARVGDLVYDGSLRTQLQTMRESLVK